MLHLQQFSLFLVEWRTIDLLNLIEYSNEIENEYELLHVLLNNADFYVSL